MDKKRKKVLSGLLLTTIPATILATVAQSCTPPVPTIDVPAVIINELANFMNNPVTAGSPSSVVIRTAILAEINRLGVGINNGVNNNDFNRITQIIFADFDVTSIVRNVNNDALYTINTISSTTIAANSSIYDNLQNNFLTSASGSRILVEVTGNQITSFQLETLTPVIPEETFSMSTITQRLDSLDVFFTNTENQNVNFSDYVNNPNRNSNALSAISLLTALKNSQNIVTDFSSGLLRNSENTGLGSYFTSYTSTTAIGQLRIPLINFAAAVSETITTGRWNLPTLNPDSSNPTTRVHVFTSNDGSDAIFLDFTFNLLPGTIGSGYYFSFRATV